MIEILQQHRQQTRERDQKLTTIGVGYLIPNKTISPILKYLQTYY